MEWREVCDESRLIKYPRTEEHYLRGGGRSPRREGEGDSAEHVVRSWLWFWPAAAAPTHSSTIRRSSCFSDLGPRLLGQPDDVVEAARPRGRRRQAGRGVKESEDGTGLFGPRLSRGTDHLNEGRAPIESFSFESFPGEALLQG